jgi:redox-sensitive bicupin YhaK (pirin superfamily)
MSQYETREPTYQTCPSTPAVETIIKARPRNIDGFTVARVLPAPNRRHVGPFLFFDHMGPVDIPPGKALDVRPHPHINLATVTYLLEGEIEHRDSLGTSETIRPGAINWMTAGRGIVHSERTPQALRHKGSRLHGLQLWVALPREFEEVEPSFRHYDATELPRVDVNRVRLVVLAGSAYGVTSPIVTHSAVLFVEAHLPPGSSLTLPQAAELGAYVIDGTVRCGEERASAGQLLVLAPGSAGVLHAEETTRIALIGGDPPDGPRHMWWNFVSSSAERIEQAKQDWKNGRFPEVPGDEEFITLPGGD